jgi:hypothetical protein
MAAAAFSSRSSSFRSGHRQLTTLLDNDGSEPVLAGMSPQGISPDLNGLAPAGGVLGAKVQGAAYCCLLGEGCLSCKFHGQLECWC